jgi:hypothetical protein
LKTILEGPLVDKCNLFWNANLKESNESLRFNLVCSFFLKVGGSHLIKDVDQKKPRWCQKMWVQKIMVQKHELFKSISLHVQGLNCGKCVYELQDHIGKEALSSNLSLKLRPIK